jgi:hypothetical protein
MTNFIFDDNLRSRTDPPPSPAYFLGLLKILILHLNRPPRSHLSFVTKFVSLKVVHSLRSIRIQNFVFLGSLVQVSHPPQKFELPPFWNDCSYSNGMTSLLNFIKIYQPDQKLKGGGLTHRKLISLAYFRVQSRLKKQPPAEPYMI